MKTAILILFCCLCCSVIAFSQGNAQAYFNTSANHYVHNRRDDALRSVQTGLQKYPNDQKLKALADKLKEEKKKEDQKRNEENKEQEKKDQQKKDQEKKEQENKEQKDQKDQNKDDQQSKEEKKDQQAKEKKDGEQENRENKDDKNEKKDNSPQLSKKLQEMKMSEDKAKMILEAMKNQEIQYLQQNKRKATKPRESGKPDW